jgi:hypothetical protein
MLGVPPLKTKMRVQMAPPRVPVRLLAALSLVFTLLLPPPAHAANVTVGCVGLQAALDASSNGDVITLTGLCTDAYTLKPGTRITLQGQSGANAGFDGQDIARTTALLTGNNVQGTVIRNLRFLHGNRSSGGGAAIDIDGQSAPTLSSLRFIDNHVTGTSQPGGAVHLYQTTALTSGKAITVTNSTIGGGGKFDGNSALAYGGGIAIEATSGQGSVVFTNNLVQNSHAGSTGGGADIYIPDGDIDVIGNRFLSANADDFGGGLSVAALSGTTTEIRGNRFSENGAERKGAGAWLDLQGPVTLTNNTFFDNSIVDGTGPDIRGAGLAIEKTTSHRITQSGNRFLENRIGQKDGTSRIGGGEYIRAPAGTQMTSLNDRFFLNSVEGSNAAGAGLAIEHNGAAPGMIRVTARNLAIAGNVAGLPGSGGGLLLSAGCTDCDGELTLRNSTIYGNFVGRGGGSSDVSGSGAALKMYNSIVGGFPVGVFESGRSTVRYSLACDSHGGPVSGRGNICKNPQLVDAFNGNIHETSASPTRDKGQNTLIGGISKDFEGQARIMDSNGDGRKRVDMGADEFKRRR